MVQDYARDALLVDVMSHVIVVVDYDPAWPSAFDEIRSALWPAVEEVAIRIDHVGSTAVPGLAAKPIIDLDIVVESEKRVGEVVARLERIGYQWVGNLGVEGREAFSAPADRKLPDHHLYLVVENNKAHLDHWLLRDVLRADPEIRAEYGRLKPKNAELANGDIDVYVAAKASFVAEQLTKARDDRGLPPAEYWQPTSPAP